MNDEKLMRVALKQAQKALAKDEVPVGCIIVRENKIIARGYDKRESTNDPTAHAEIIAIRKASKKLGTWRLQDCDLYVTLEPCPMCLGTAILARIKRIIYGTENPKFGAITSIINLLHSKWNHKMKVTSGILNEQCSEILKRYFKNKRHNQQE